MLSALARAYLTGAALSAWWEVLAYESEEGYDPAEDTGYRELAILVAGEIEYESSL